MGTGDVWGLVMCVDSGNVCGTVVMWGTVVMCVGDRVGTGNVQGTGGQ